MTKPGILALALVALLTASPAHAGDTQGAPSSPARAAEAPKAPAAGAQSPGGVSFTRDVKQAWAQAREDGRRAGRAIGDGARAVGRATRDAAVNSWKSIKEAFSG